MSESLIFAILIVALGLVAYQIARLRVDLEPLLHATSSPIVTALSDAGR